MVRVVRLNGRLGDWSMATRWGQDHEPVTQRFLLVQETSSVLGVSAMTLYRMIQERQFPALKLRSRWIVPAGAIGELTASPMAPAQTLGPALMDVPVVARTLRVSAATLYRLIHEGGFPAVWLRGRVLVPGGVIDDMVAAALASRAAIDPKDWVNGDRSANRADGTAALRADAEK
jgi:excisionase family DNA binding protein